MPDVGSSEQEVLGGVGMCWRGKVEEGWVQAQGGDCCAHHEGHSLGREGRGAVGSGLPGKGAGTGRQALVRK